jgi:DNA mismatch repair protein MutL
LPRIQKLPDDIVNKIAAGEVVERPASVVKELVENAVDAEARSVRVEIDAGGKSRIRVRDDGHGMSREDAQAAIERHATSKLTAFEDLQSISTHGFRGEALPSIASVSDLTLLTRDGEGDAGTEVRVRHGEILHVKDAGHPRGTTVEVADLFGAVPARRKFLRADPTEASHVAEAMTLLALSRPAVRFLLLSGGRNVFDAPPADGLEARLYQLYGGAFLEGMVPVEGGLEWVRVRGFTSRPDRPGPSRPNVRLFVNGRAVRDRALMKAVAEAYRGSGAGSHAPETFLFVVVPAHMVDVNVHPAKTEVRFADARAVWIATERAMGEALSRGARKEAPVGTVSDLRPLLTNELRSRVMEAVETYASPASPSPYPSPLMRPRSDQASSGGLVGSESHTSPVEETSRGLEGPPGERGVPSPLEYAVLGQHRDTYIVCSDGQELVLIDQHSAHERIRFEALRARAEQRTAESQGLLLPIVTTVPPALRELLRAQADSLSLLGYDVEAFGGDSVRISAVPALLGPSDPAAALLGILTDLAEREDSDWNVAGARDRLAATLACHSAVRAGQRLNMETMAAIARDLPGTLHPNLCPHGRPTIMRIARDDVSRWFGRSGWKRR